MSAIVELISPMPDSLKILTTTSKGVWGVSSTSLFCLVSFSLLMVDDCMGDCVGICVGDCVGICVGFSDALLKGIILYTAL